MSLPTPTALELIGEFRCFSVDWDPNHPFCRGCPYFASCGERKQAGPPIPMTSNPRPGGPPAATPPVVVQVHHHHYYGHKVEGPNPPDPNVFEAEIYEHNVPDNRPGPEAQQWMHFLRSLLEYIRK